MKESPSNHHVPPAPSGRLLWHVAIWMAAASLLLALWVHVFELVASDLIRTQTTAKNEIANLARVSQEHAERTFNSVDQVLRSVQFEYAHHANTIDIRAMQKAGLFDSHVLLQVSVADAKGLLEQSTLEHSNQVDLSDREHFTVHLRNGVDTLYISKPLQGRVTGKLSIQMSRPLYASDGTFAGVVIASLDPAYFTHFYSELQLGSQGVATLFGMDGAVRARHSGQQDQYSGDLSKSPVFELVGKNIFSGAYTTPGIIDGVDRMLYFRKLPDYPMLVAIGAGTQEALANHRLTAKNLMGQAILASVFMLSVAALTSWYVIVRRRHSHAKAQSLATLQELTSRVPGAVYQLLIHPDGRSSFPFVSAGFQMIIGTATHELVHDASRLLSLVHPDDRAQRQDALAFAMAAHGPWEREFRICPADGTTHWVHSTATPQHLSDGSVLWHGYVSDVTERKLAEAQVRIAATAFESHDGTFVADQDGNILRVNHAFCEITGYSAEEAIGQTPRLLRSGRHDADFYRAMHNQLASTGAWQGEIWNRRKSGEIYPEWLTITAVRDDNGHVSHYVANFSDISGRKVAEDQIMSLAFYDPLTQLPNRRLLLDRLRQALASSTPFHRNGALLFIDLDEFKILNDTQGHTQGDLMLREVANRLSFCVRGGDTVARLGSDEFVVLLQGLAAERGEAGSQARTVGEQIVATLGQTYQLNNFTHHGSASVGIALFNGSEFVVEDLLKRADLAVHKAKQSGGNTLRFFDPEMQASMSARASLESDLRAALQEEQFLLYYQPQVDGNGSLIGAEALVRWLHPQRGMVSPAEFIPLAEETRLILPLGQWVLEAACQQLCAWQQLPDKAHLTIAVNVSALQFLGEQFVPDVLQTLARTGAPAKRLKLELTESLLVHDVGNIIAKMTELKAHGVGFSLDDFGTGYSSLSYLKRLPLDQLKIDQSFVRDALTNSKDAAIIQATITLGHSLGMMVIAEGVETQTQREFLQARGCNNYQGYLFGRPAPVAMLSTTPAVGGE